MGELGFGTSPPPSDLGGERDIPQRPQVGGEPPLLTSDPLVVFFYVLLRDHIQAGVFERLVTEMVDAPVSLTNRFLGAYAENLAQRLRPLAEPSPFVLTPEEAEAISNCISVAARMGSAYETYGGVQVGPAVRKANEALDRLDVPHETEVEG